MKRSSSMEEVLCCRSNAARDTRPGPAGYLEHTCMHTLMFSHTHKHTDNKEINNILSAVDTCVSFCDKNWFSLRAKCAWQAQTGQALRDMGAEGPGT